MRNMTWSGAITFYGRVDNLKGSHETKDFFGPQRFLGIWSPMRIRLYYPSGKHGNFAADRLPGTAENPSGGAGGGGESPLYWGGGYP